MLCNMDHITFRVRWVHTMSIGTSGRIVIEVDPTLKRELHAALLMEGLTMKDWFVKQAGEFVESRQLPLKFVLESSAQKKY